MMKAKRSSTVDEDGPSIGRRWLPLFLLALCFPLVGNRSNCDTRATTLVCAMPSITVAPGQCVDLQNPCGADWVAQDAFELCDPPEGLNIQTTRRRGGVTRRLCAVEAAEFALNEPVDFVYSLVDDFGQGRITLTVGTPLSVVATASAALIAPGEDVELNAAAAGGVSPYSYSWSGADTLSDPNIAMPTASPTETTTYVVTVTDSIGNVADDSVTVTVAVDVPLLVTANPSTIPVGFNSQLNVVVGAGVPPFSYSWAPAVLLNSATVHNPIAFPASTTTFTVDVVDANGAAQSGSVVVTVLLQGSVSANPSILVLGESSQLVANAAGGSPPYQYGWTEDGGGNTLSTTSGPDPVATPIEDTTYTVTVTDAVGSSIQRDVQVIVNPPDPPLTACLTVSPDPPPGIGTVTFDFSCSTGTIVLFELWRNWTGDPNQLPSYSGSSNSVSFVNEGFGATTARLRVTDPTGAQDVQDFTVVYQ